MHARCMLHTHFLKGLTFKKPSVERGQHGQGNSLREGGQGIFELVGWPRPVLENLGNFAMESQAAQSTHLDEVHRKMQA